MARYFYTDADLEFAEYVVKLFDGDLEYDYDGLPQEKWHVEGVWMGTRVMCMRMRDVAMSRYNSGEKRFRSVATKLGREQGAYAMGALIRDKLMEKNAAVAAAGYVEVDAKPF